MGGHLVPKLFLVHITIAPVARNQSYAVVAEDERAAKELVANLWHGAADDPSVFATCTVTPVDGSILAL